MATATEPILIILDNDSISCSTSSLGLTDYHASPRNEARHPRYHIYRLHVRI